MLLAIVINNIYYDSNISPIPLALNVTCHWITYMIPKKNSKHL